MSNNVLEMVVWYGYESHNYFCGVAGECPAKTQEVLIQSPGIGVVGRTRMYLLITFALISYTGILDGSLS